MNTDHDSMPDDPFMTCREVVGNLMIWEKTDEPEGSRWLLAEMPADPLAPWVWTDLDLYGDLDDTADDDEGHSVVPVD